MGRFIRSLKSERPDYISFIDCHTVKANFLKHAYPGYRKGGSIDPEAAVDVSADFQWWFQEFDVKARTKPKISASKHVEVGALDLANTIVERLTERRTIAP